MENDKININNNNKNEEKEPGAARTRASASNEDETRRSIIARMGDQISDLLDFVTPRHNVHGDIKKKVSALSTTYSRLIKLEQKVTKSSEEISKNPAATQATQTSPKAAVGRTNSLSQGFSGLVTKRKPTPLDGGSPKKLKGRKPTPDVEGPKQGKAGQDKSADAPENKWIRVTRKSRKTRKLKKRPALPSALLIQKTGSLSYAEILSKIKADDELRNYGEAVTKIRRTKAGEMILILDKANEEKATKLCEAFKGALGGEALIKRKVKHSLLEIKDLDEIATKEEVKVAIQKFLGQELEVGLDNVKSIRKGYGGTQTAVVSLPTAASDKLSRAGQLRVGWVVCRVREIIRPLKCFRCWQYGHLSKDCRSETDRSRCCRKCGNEGHKADDCQSEPHCLLCRGNGKEVDLKHSAGSNKCAVYKRAYQDALRKQR